MGQIRVHEFVTVDGVFETPAWTSDYGFDPKMGEAIAGIMGAVDGLLLGRRTYEMFAASWAGRTAQDDPGAPFMNESPKYVVSSTLTEPDWNNSTVLGRYDAETIAGLKDRSEKGLYVSGSGTLVRALLADGLVDEVHLFVYPLALGKGERLFDERGPGARFRLTGDEAYENGVLHLTYAPEPG
jgi:dihydrofolate reductase